MKCNRDITLVHYMSMGSALHRIEVRAKIIELIALIITIFMVPEITAFAMMFLFSIWVMRQSKLPLRYVLRVLDLGNETIELPLRYVLRVMQGGQHAGTKDWGWRGASPW
jgi:hypothetical protein